MKGKFILISKLAAGLLFYLGGSLANAQTITLTGPAGSGQFGQNITVLTNGNYVISDPYWDNGATADVGAVYLYNGNTHALISTLTGSTANDHVGSGGIFKLSNGNFIVLSSLWDNGAIVDAGAATWVDGSLGFSGVVSSSNSLVGSTTNDRVGITATALTNGNYVVGSWNWHNGAIATAGAATWGNGATGISGAISSSNSLIGSTANNQISSAGITALMNGNYIVNSPFWDNGATSNVGAVTWGSGVSGISGVVSSSNSLIGSALNDLVGGSGITTLPNGNYLVKSTSWHNGPKTNAGAVTWGNGLTGISGVVSSSNSLVGSSSSDMVGTIQVLLNGNYVVVSTGWDNGSITDVGAVTWGSGASGVTGTISSSNSLVGSTSGDEVGMVTVLSNSNYVVSALNWDDGIKVDVGAAAFGNGTTGTSGVISSSNALIGSDDFDNVANGGVVVLSNGNYIVRSYFWNGGVGSLGAATWGSGTAGIAGVISSSNSLIGASSGDMVSAAGVTALTNGNYVVQTPDFNGENGAATWGNGTTGTSGIISGSNSLVGSTSSDNVGDDILALTNGNYVVLSPFWDNGAIADVGAATFGIGSSGISGTIGVGNSLVGSTSGDQVGNHSVALSNGNYVIGSNMWDNGSFTDVGAATWGNGTSGTIGTINTSNSLIGTTSNDQISGDGLTALANGNYLVSSTLWNNGAAVDAGALTWGDGSQGVVGTVSVSNSLVGSTSADGIGTGISTESHGEFILKNASWDGVANNSGSYCFCTGTSALTGTPTVCNSVLGNVASSTSSSSFQYNPVNEYLLVGLYTENKVVIFTPATETLASSSTNSTQAIAGTGKAPFVDNSCQLINSLQQSGSSPVAGSIANQVYIESTAPSNAGRAFVRRHYEITPANNPGTATATVTLYFTQADFDDYNANNGSDPDLPTGPSDATGIAQMRISHQHGTSITGAPGSYTGLTEQINPIDDRIVWNSLLSRWEITFDITGFSGLFIYGDAAPLSIGTLSFDAKLLNSSDVLLNWTVANHAGDQNYTVERSSDGNSFAPVSTLKASSNSDYSMHDLQPLKGKSYYRLRTTTTDGKITYSDVRGIYIGGQNDGIVNVYPSPARDYIKIECSNSAVSGTLSNMEGRTLMRLNTATGERIDISMLPAGVYVLKLSNGYCCKIVKE